MKDSWRVTHAYRVVLHSFYASVGSKEFVKDTNKDKFCAWMLLNRTQYSKPENLIGLFSGPLGSHYIKNKTGAKTPEEAVKKLCFTFCPEKDGLKDLFIKSRVSINRLAEFLKEENLTMEQGAEFFGVCRNTIFRYLKNPPKKKTQQVVKIERKLSNFYKNKDKKVEDGPTLSPVSFEEAEEINSVEETKTQKDIFAEVLSLQKEILSTQDKLMKLQENYIKAANDLSDSIKENPVQVSIKDLFENGLSLVSRRRTQESVENYHTAEQNQGEFLNA